MISVYLHRTVSTCLITLPAKHFLWKIDMKLSFFFFKLKNNWNLELIQNLKNSFKHTWILERNIFLKNYWQEIEYKCVLDFHIFILVEITMAVESNRNRHRHNRTTTKKKLLNFMLHVCYCLPMWESSTTLEKKSLRIYGLCLGRWNRIMYLLHIHLKYCLLLLLL